MTEQPKIEQETEQVIPTLCASHCGGECLLKVHVKAGVITRIETDDGPDPQIRACLRGRSYRQRVYDPGRILYPLKRTGDRGEGKFERISWDEALDRVAGELKRVRETYGPGAIGLCEFPGDYASLTNYGPMGRLLNLAGGYTGTWGSVSVNGLLFSCVMTYGTTSVINTCDDIPNSRFIILWGINQAETVQGTNTQWYLSQAKEAGARIVVVDPRFTNTAAVLGDQWIPIRPGTDAAMLIAMAHVMIDEGLFDTDFVARYTVGFDKYRDYVMGLEDGIAKTPGWAAEITGVSSDVIERLAREYAGTKPAALVAGPGPGRTAYGEQYHRAAMVLAAMTGNVGTHGGNAGGGFGMGWMTGLPYAFPAIIGDVNLGNWVPNPVEEGFPWRIGGGDYFAWVLGKDCQLNNTKWGDALLKGRSGGYNADIKLLYIKKANPVNSMPNTNKIIEAFKSRSLEFIVVEEQVMTATAEYADIVLPTNTYMEREDMGYGMSLLYIGKQNKVIEPLGESRSPLQIARDLAERMDIHDFLDNKTDEELLRERAALNGIPDYEQWKREGIYRLDVPEPYVALKAQIEDPANNPFPTPSGKIEIFSQTIADVGNPLLSPIPKYIETWESRNDPLAKKYPLQLISTHFKRRANATYENVPWLRELQEQTVLMNSEDARARDIRNGDMVRVFNDRGEIIIKAGVTERIMPGVVDVPEGAWHKPDEKGVDLGGCANVLTRDEHSPGGASTYNTALVEIRKA